MSVQAACDAVVAMIHTGQGDPLAATERILRAHPRHVFAHCLRAALFFMAANAEGNARLAHALRAANALPASLATERERRHLAAAAAWLRRDLKRALQMYGDIARDYPHDTLALRVAHAGDLHWARPEQLRDRVGAALAHWSERMPGYGHVLGMHAFGLTEAGEHGPAERAGRRALGFDSDNTGAIKANAHVLEMRGHAADGIRWLRGTQSAWERSGYATHLWWHLALYCLDTGDTLAALRIHDGRLTNYAGQGMSVLVDSSALLWRLALCGVDVGRRWETVADAWEAQPLGSLRPFNDTHAMLAFAATGRAASAIRLLQDLRARAAHTQDLSEPIHEAALPICEALARFGAGDYAAAATGIQQYRHLTQRCGGSRAQCDLLHLTLLEAAWRSGRTETARALVTERIALRPESRLNQRLQARVGSSARARSASVRAQAATQSA